MKLWKINIFKNSEINISRTLDIHFPKEAKEGVEISRMFSHISAAVFRRNGNLRIINLLKNN